MNVESEFVSEFLEQRDVAAALAAKNKIRPDTDTLDFPEVAGQAADEILHPPCPLNFSIKMNQQQRVRAQ